MRLIAKRDLDDHRTRGEVAQAIGSSCSTGLPVTARRSATRPTATRRREVEVSPDLAAYAAGEIPIPQIRCVLCKTALCYGARCPTCRFTEQARYGGCPRGCGQQSG